jgi:hypothetical protein
MPGKIIKLEDGRVRALVSLARDQMKTFQELAEEAFAALLRKYDVPKNLKDALRRSVRAGIGNGDHR